MSYRPWTQGQANHSSTSAEDHGHPYAEDPEAELLYQEDLEPLSPHTGYYYSGEAGGSSHGTSYGHSSVPIKSSSSPGMTPHVWIERNNIAPIQSLRHLIVEISRDGVKSFFCGWKGCKYPVGFAKQAQLVTHIRSVHLQEKPFLCTTCNAAFERKQDVIRHVNTMNSRKQYMCSGCERMFPRKQIRDLHEESCLSQGPSGSGRR